MSDIPDTVYNVDNAPTTQTDILTRRHVYIGSKNGITSYWADGKLHRDDGPAIIADPANHGLLTIDPQPSNDIKCKYLCTQATEVWYNNGKLHRIGGPAIYGPKTSIPVVIRSIKPDGSRVNVVSLVDYPETELYAVNGLYHREGDEPAVSFKGATGKRHIVWYQNGVVGRDPSTGGPSHCIINPNGTVVMNYYVNGKLHRDPRDGEGYAQYVDVNGKTNGRYFVDGTVYDTYETALEAISKYDTLCIKG